MKMIMSDVLKNRDAVPRDLATLIDMQAAAKPEALAIIAPIGRLTYGAVSTMISRIAAGLASTGLKPGDNVAVTLGKNVPELLTILALSRIGCTACIRFGMSNLEQVDVAACIHADDTKLMGPRPILFDPAWLEEAPDAAKAEQWSAVPEGRPVIYTTSSGSTGWPKVIPCSMERLYHAVFDSLHHPSHEPTLNPCLVSLGVGSLWGFRQFLTLLWTGGTVMLGAIHATTASQFRHAGIRHVVASTSQLYSWLTVARENPGFFSGCEAITVGGGPLSESMAKDVREFICPTIYVNYGSSETGLIAAGKIDIDHGPYASTGYVLKSAKVQVLNDAGQAVRKRGVSGIIRCQTGAMAESDKLEGFRDGWFYTGDIGEFSSDGQLVIIGRSNQIFNSGGVKVSIEIAEEKLRATEGILDVALFPVESGQGLELLGCAYVAAPGMDTAIRKGWLRGLPLAGPPMPVQAIPRGTNEKVQRQELAEAYGVFLKSAKEKRH